MEQSVMKKRIGEILIEAGLLTKEQVEQVVEEQEKSDKRFGEILVEKGWASERDICNVLSFQLGIPYINLNITPVEPEAIEKIPLKMAREYNLLPYSIDRRTIAVCMDDPLNLIALEEIRKVTGLEVRPSIGTSKDIRNAIKKHYNLVDSLMDVVKTMSGVDKGTHKVSYGDTGPIPTPKSSRNAAPIIKIVNSLISTGVKNRASDIHIEPQGKRVLIRIRIDGLLREVMKLPKWTQGAVISRIKVMARLDTSEKKVPQNGLIKLKVSDHVLELRVSVLPTNYGEKVVIKICETAKDLIPLEKLGFFKNDLKKIQDTVKSRKGVFLCVGPARSGKTTTFYSIMKHIKNDSMNIVTLENPIKYDINGINQVRVNEKTGLTFANGFRAILRQDPNIIMVDEILESETAALVMQASFTGHFILSSFHANDTISAISRLIDLGVQPFLVGSAVTTILAQRLVRKICSRCKKQYQPTEEELIQLGLLGRKKFEKQLFKGEGCSNCQHTGYKGRIGVFEILRITSRLRELIISKMPETALLQEAKNSGFKTLASDCLQKVKAGVTTLEEYNRVILQEEEMASLCPNCQNMIKNDFIACPYCGYSIVESCTSCGRSKEPDWRCCPYCRQPFADIIPLNNNPNMNIFTVNE